jgi:hypothetical protein
VKHSPGSLESNPVVWRVQRQFRAQFNKREVAGWIPNLGRPHEVLMRCSGYWTHSFRSSVAPWFSASQRQRHAAEATMRSDGLGRIAQFLHIAVKQNVMCNENKKTSGG